MNNISEILTAVTAILIFFELLFAVVSTVRHQKWERRLSTLDHYEKIESELKSIKKELFDKYGDPIQPKKVITINKSEQDRVKVRRVLNMYERMSVGINSRLFDLETINQLCGLALIRNYERFENYIENHRRKQKGSTTWQDFRKVVDKLRKKRKMSGRTYRRCYLSGEYTCSSHLGKTISLSEGMTFPSCSIDNGHSATWILVGKV